MKDRDTLDDIERTRTDIKTVIASTHRQSARITIVVTAGHVTYRYSLQTVLGTIGTIPPAARYRANALSFPSTGRLKMKNRKMEDQIRSKANANYVKMQDQKSDT